MPRLRSSENERNPDTIFLFGLCVFAGLGQALAGAAPGSVEDLLPQWAAVLWGSTLVFSGGLVLWGTIRKDPERGEGIELIGRCIFGPFAVSYGVAILSAQQDPRAGWLAAAPFFGFGLTCAWRAYKIVKRRNTAVALAKGR